MGGKMGKYPSNNSFLSAVSSFLIILYLCYCNLNLRNFVCKNPQLTCSNNFYGLKNIIGGIWDLSYTTFLDNQAGSTLDVFRSQVQLGVLFFVCQPLG
jgi:hypothetical protein